MNDFLTLLAALGAIAGYGLFAGIAVGMAPSDEPEAAPLVAIFWPVAIPGMLGFALVRHLKRERPAKLPKARVL